MGVPVEEVKEVFKVLVMVASVKVGFSYRGWRVVCGLAVVGGGGADGEGGEGEASWEA